MKAQDEIIEFLKSNGVADVGFAKVNDAPFEYDVSIVVKLSEAVISEITDEPTHTYFHHYRTVNAFVDRMILQCGFILEKHGYKYIPVGASQSINKDGWNYLARYSHKKAAVLAGLGSIGKNDLFLHKKFGAAVRLGTLFTDCPFEITEHKYISTCIGCNRCVEACPAKALTGVLWQEGTQREKIINPEACSTYMKKKFQHIGRGAVCGICMKVCPVGKEGKNG